MGFRKMLTERQQRIGSVLCVGLDPKVSKIPACLLVTRDAGGFTSCVVAWMKGIIDATAPWASVYKPNIAQWVGLGEGGLEALREVIAYIHENYPDIPVFLDCKRGDIMSTQAHYINADLEYLNADGMNFSPYMGKDTMAALASDESNGKALVGLGYTSNPAARQVQDICIQEDGSKYWEFMVKCIYEWACNLGVVADAGLVIAAAHKDYVNSTDRIISEHLSEARNIVGADMWFLIPGVGTQGGFVEQTVKAAFRGAGTIVINSSSGISEASSGKDYASAAGREAEKLSVQMREAGADCSA